MQLQRRRYSDGCGVTSCRVAEQVRIGVWAAGCINREARKRVARRRCLVWRLPATAKRGWKRATAQTTTTPHTQQWRLRRHRGWTAHHICHFPVPVAISDMSSRDSLPKLLSSRFVAFDFSPANCRRDLDANHVWLSRIILKPAGALDSSSPVSTLSPARPHLLRRHPSLHTDESPLPDTPAACPHPAIHHL